MQQSILINFNYLVAHKEALFHENLLYMSLLRIKPHAKPHANSICFILSILETVIITCVYVFFPFLCPSPTWRSAKARISNRAYTAGYQRFAHRLSYGK